MNGSYEATLIHQSDSIFIAGARGMAGSAIMRALNRKGYGNASKGGTLLTPTRQQLNLSINKQ